MKSARRNRLRSTSGLALAGGIIAATGIGVAAQVGASPDAETADAATLRDSSDDAIQRYLDSRGLSKSATLGDLTEMPTSEWQNYLATFDIAVPNGILDIHEIDRIVGELLLAQGDASGAPLVLSSGRASTESIQAALKRLAPDVIDVPDRAVGDTVRARPELSRDDAQRFAYYQRLTEITGLGLSELIPGFSTFAIRTSPSGNPSLELLVRADNAQQARDLLASSPALREVDVVEVRFSAEELVDMVEEAMKRLASSGTDIAEIAGAETMEEVNIYPNKREEGAAERIKELVIADPVLKSWLEADLLRIEEPSEPIQETATVRGGTPATTCSWGFTGDNGSRPAILTAGHCGPEPTGGGSTQSYQGILFPYISGTDFNNQDVDVQAHRIPSGNNVTNQVVTTFGTVSITSETHWPSIALQSTVCQAAKDSPYDCGTIVGKTSGGKYVKVEGVIVSFGDSGGAWLKGNSAYGIGHAKQGNTTGFFGAINFAEFYSGTQIRLK